MALVIIAVFTTHKDNTVHTLGQGIFDPDGVHRTQTPHGNYPDIRRVINPIHAHHVKGWIGIIFTHQCQNPEGRLIKIIFRWNANGLYLGTNTVNGIIGKGNDSFRACTHAGTASSTPGGIDFGCPLFIIIQGTKGTLHRTTFTLGASLEKEFWIGLITGSGMNRNPSICR